MIDPARPFRLRGAPAALVVLVLSVLSTIGVWRLVDQNVRLNEQARFDNHVEAAQEAIVQRLETYIHSLRGAAAFYGASDAVTRADWRAYVEGLELAERYPGIQGLGFSVRLKAGELAAHEARVRAEGLPDYAVHPRAPRRDEYHSIVYLEPLDWRNRRAIGYDMYAEPTRREAMARARDTGAPAMSGKVRLVQETAEAPQAGFLIYLPIYAKGMPTGTVEERRRALVGFAYSPFRADDLFQGIFAGQRLTYIGFEIYDREVAPDRLMHDHNRTRDGAPGRVGPLLARTNEVAIAGHPWRIVYTSQPAFASFPGRFLSWVVILSGLAISGLLSGITWTLATGRERAEAEVAARTRELRLANARLRDADRYKDEFLGIVSHELRTPLNFISGFASLLDDEVSGPLNDEQRAYAGKILAGADRMLRIVEDMLDVASIQAGKVTLAIAPADYAAMLAQAVAEMKPLADRKGIALVLVAGPLPPVPLDRRRVMQVLTNLLSNAIKFTPEGGCVTVRASLADGNVLTEVTDTGKGIAETELLRVFEKFHQVDMSATREAGGTGLGLAIARAFVDAHGGTIGASSRLGEGSTFFFTLPLGALTSA